MKGELVKLDDICLSISDGDHLPPPKSVAGVPFVTISNIDSYNQLDFSNTAFVPYEYYEKIDDKRKAQIGDILYSVVGSYGIPVLIKENRLFTFQRHIAILRPDPEKVCSSFLYYVMRSSGFYHRADNVAIGAAQKTITLTALRNMRIEVPTIEEQQRIASILSRYDDLIANYRQQIKLLEETAQRVYKEWFVDMKFPNHENAVFGENGLPEGWKYATIQDVALVNACCLAKDSDLKVIDYVDLGSVREGQIESITRFNRGDEPGRAKRIAKDGDIIWGMVRPNLKSYALVQAPKESMVFSTGFAVITPIKVPFTYLYEYVTTEQFIGYLINCTNGAAYPAVKPCHFKEAKFILPTDFVIGKYHHLVEPMMREKARLEKKISYLTEARDRLLPRLMSGEIAV